MAGDPVLVDDVERAVLDGLPARRRARGGHRPPRRPRSRRCGDETLAARADDVRSLGPPGDAAGGRGDEPRPPRRPPTRRRILVADELGPADVAELGPDIAGIALAARRADRSRRDRRPRPRAAARRRARARSSAEADGTDRGGRRGGGRRCSRPRPPAPARPPTRSEARRAERAQALADRALPAVTLDGHRVRVLVNAATARGARRRPRRRRRGRRAAAHRARLPRGRRRGRPRPQHRARDRARAPGPRRPHRHRARARLRRRQDAAVPRRHAASAGSSCCSPTPTRSTPSCARSSTPAATPSCGSCCRWSRPPSRCDAVRRAACPRGVSLGAMIETPAPSPTPPPSRPPRTSSRSAPTTSPHAVLGSDRFGGAAASATTRACSPRWRPPPRAAAAARRSLEVCGEAASEPDAVPLLVGLGVDELSVGAARVGAVRGWIRALPLRRATAGPRRSRRACRARRARRRRRPGGVGRCRPWRPARGRRAGSWRRPRGRRRPRRCCAWKPIAVRTNCAAGRACRSTPAGSETSRSELGDGTGLLRGGRDVVQRHARPRRRPRRRPRPPRAARRRAGREPLPFTRSSSTWRAVRIALPRSPSTIAPSPWSAAAIAAPTSVPSVPSPPSGAPPAASMRTSGPAICAASAAVPAAISRLCDTITMPTTRASLNYRSRFDNAERK